MRKRLLALVACICLLAGCTQRISELNQRVREKTVITVLHGQSTSDPGLEDMLSSKINEAFPEVELEWESVDWGDYFSSEMQAKIAAGEVPDLIIGKAQDVAGYYSSGVLGEFDSSFNEYISEEALSSVTIDETLYGIPYNALYQGVLYNKNIFRRYNLQVPATVEELQYIVDRLNQVGVTPFASHYKESWYSANVLMQCAVNEVFSVSSDWGALFRSNEVNFTTSDEYIFCFKQVEFILQNSWPDALKVLQDECDKRFANEEAAMYVSGTWSIQTIESISPMMQLGIFPYPNSSGDAGLLFEPNITFMKNSNGENEELVEKIILAFIQDGDLSESVSQFTQTESMLKDVQSNGLTMIKADVEQYRDEGKVTDVSIGNVQIVWSFQEGLANEMYSWFEGNIGLEDVLIYADQRRSGSGGYT